MILNILKDPDERLRIVAEPVMEISNEIKHLAIDMIDTMYAYKGMGLAATQINQAVRMIVIDLSEEYDSPITLINPRITAKRGLNSIREGCLSVEGKEGIVDRSEIISVHCKNLEGEVVEFECDGLLSICIQHEIDHLNGILFIDKIRK
jgi:peptide deformylase